MRTSVRGFKRWLREATMFVEASVDIRPSRDERARSSVLGVKNRRVDTKAGSKLAQRLEPDLVDMVNASYASVGGNPKISVPGDISAEYPDWVLADVDDDPDADVLIAGNKGNHGGKISLMATDGTMKAKSFMLSLKRQLYKNGWWAEVSDAPAHIALNKFRIKPIEDEKKVRMLLGDKKITWHGEHPEGKFPGTHGWYSRDIGGTSHAKIIVGDV